MEKTLRCRMKVKGHLSNRWSAWFGQLQISTLPEGQSELSGEVLDRAALYGLINRLRDLDVLLLDLHVEEFESHEPREGSSGEGTNGSVF